MQPTYDPNAKVKVTTSSPLARSVAVSIGDVLIPVTDVLIHMAVNDFTTITLTTKADLVDVEALQQQTRVVVLAPLKIDDVEAGGA